MPASIEISNYYFQQISSFCCFNVLMYYAVLITGGTYRALVTPLWQDRQRHSLHSGASRNSSPPTFQPEFRAWKWHAYSPPLRTKTQPNTEQGKGSTSPSFSRYAEHRLQSQLPGSQPTILSSLKTPNSFVIAPNVVSWSLSFFGPRCKGSKESETPTHFTKFVD